MTEEQNKLAELVALSEKATQGEWRDDAGYRVYGPLRLRESEFDTGESFAPLLFETKYTDATYHDSTFIAALVDWFRANITSLRSREPATEAVLMEKVAVLLETFAEYGMLARFEHTDERTPNSFLCESAAKELRAALKGKGASQGAMVHDFGEFEGRPLLGISAPDAPEPSGEFVRVPREPTQEMRNAGRRALLASSGGPTTQLLDAYRAMLAAASPDEQKG